MGGNVCFKNISWGNVLLHQKQSEGRGEMFEIRLLHTLYGL